MELLYYQINRLLMDSSRILIITHRRPDEDAIGSSLSFLNYLKSLNKQVTVFTIDPIPGYLRFLPGATEIINDPEVFNEYWDLRIFLDCGSIGNTGLEERLALKGKIINIDHHVSNPSYGLLNLINIKASSTCEMVYDFFKFVGFEPDRQVATCLLAGILGDTSGFVHSTTQAKTVLVASELVKKGLKIHQIFDFAVRNKSLAGLKLWGEVLSRLKINQELSIAYTWIKDEDFNEFMVDSEELDGLANFLNVIVEAKVTVLFRLGKESLRANWRTKSDDVDLSLLCSYFGGGGHRKAAGFTVPWQVVEKNGELVVL
jgi:bifunctional oligoribonuclease and PAP phosphatase NrnA